MLIQHEIEKLLCKQWRMTTDLFWKRRVLFQDFVYNLWVRKYNLSFVQLSYTTFWRTFTKDVRSYVWLETIIDRVDCVIRFYPSLLWWTQLHCQPLSERCVYICSTHTLPVRKLMTDHLTINWYLLVGKILPVVYERVKRSRQLLLLFKADKVWV